jgi:hypothetical protein
MHPLEGLVLKCKVQSKGVQDIKAICPGRVVDILEASGAFDPGSNPGRGVLYPGYIFISDRIFLSLIILMDKKKIIGYDLPVPSLHRT